MRHEARGGVEVCVGGFVATEEIPCGVGEGGMARGVGSDWELGRCSGARSGGGAGGSGHCAAGKVKGGKREGDEDDAAGGRTG